MARPSGFPRSLAIALAVGLAPLTISAQTETLGTESATVTRRSETLVDPVPTPPITGSRMSCGTARLVSAPLGAGVGAVGTFIMYELLTSATTMRQTPTAGPDVRPAASNRTALMLVGGGLGLVWGVLAPPVARECWVQIPRRSSSVRASAAHPAVPQGRLGFSQSGDSDD